MLIEVVVEVGDCPKVAVGAARRVKVENCGGSSLH